jgi:hypothetical protein
MELPQNNIKPWALLFILLGIVLLVMAWTSYDFILRIIVTLGALVLADYGMGLLGLPTPSQLISSLISHFTKRQ